MTLQIAPTLALGLQGFRIAVKAIARDKDKYAQVISTMNSIAVQM